ncbi:alpha amylase C-terminal domain-containing protein [Hymenobacter latericus]|uniref:alpha amylase C-terminal domain-containing protein n=1 Tax=Hymenobacter sp. YIM 151858-1 TaxID=2987688 RepID=UPI0022264A1B|nr:alpha amylase C-terminal domain-containing protein [Hymenobacter sp. YIM 151858-1]UYZ59365.1 alpha amylase C-terminal domain-containing protein [Hymenobacter sp. YIM 151858-1]
MDTAEVTAPVTAAEPQLPLVQQDPWLAPFADVIQRRLARFEQRLAEIQAECGSLARYACRHQQFGLHYDVRRRGYWFREWAPAAEAVSIMGDFNQWDRHYTPLTRRADGVWEVFLSEQTFPNLVHGSRYKVHIVAANGSRDRLPATVRRVVQDEHSKDFAAQVWRPEQPFQWTDQQFRVNNYVKEPLIYEAHVGMALEEGRVGTWREFADYILPRIQADGYNVVQLMAVAEHPYYGSFGYHVANFFAPSARFGTPEDLKYLVNEAHRRGLAVVMDVVHSHSVKNEAEGLGNLDGSDNLYFHKGERGRHPGWDSLLFDYGRPEVQQFLLSNLRYWLEEFHFDGFRFDGVTSMLYHHHGEGTAFTEYGQYFGPEADDDAILYLQLATALVKECKKSALLIAEDMSGLPGLARPLKEGGIGFDYRLGMGLPDFWIKTLKHQRDEDWNLGGLWHQLSNRRAGEKTVAYAESHDQALVGDKTLSHWLLDARVYSSMSRLNSPDIETVRGVALHKMIRLVTLGAGGEAYMNFIGNEFGHPEWVDFPREGNNWSHHHARRQWSLADNPDLYYHAWLQFDHAMIALERRTRFLNAGPARLLHIDEDNKVMAFERGSLVFVFNFHPERSLPDYRFFAGTAGTYVPVLDSDESQFGGFGRITAGIKHFTQPDEHGTPFLSLYLPTRTAQVLQRVK